MPSWETIDYVVDDPSANRSVPFQRANEATPYLTFIIENYDKLPSTVVFHHADLIAWHDEEDVGNAKALLERLQIDVVCWKDCVFAPG